MEETLTFEETKSSLVQDLVIESAFPHLVDMFCLICTKNIKVECAEGSLESSASNDMSDIFIRPFGADLITCEVTEVPHD